MDISNKYRGDIARALRKENFDVSEGGIVIAAGIKVRGVYDDWRNGEHLGETPNLIVDQGFVDMLNTYFHTTNKKAGFYVALFAGAVSPAANWTAASFASTASEITSGSEGYSETTRRPFTVAAATTPQIDNYGTKAAFTIVTASQLNVNGPAILSDSTKGGTSGVLVSASRYANTRVLQNGDAYEVGYRYIFSAA